MEFLRKYNTATHVYVPMVKRGVVDFAIGADWTPAAGDVKVSIDGGAAANIGTLPSAIAMGNTAYWDFTLSGGETTGRKVVVTVADSATKAVEDQEFGVITYGNASAEIVQDISASVAQTGDSFARLGATGSGLTSILNVLPSALGADGSIKATVQGYLGTAFTEGAAGRFATNFKTFFNVAAATGTQDVTPTTTTLTNAPPDSSGVTSLLARLGAFTGTGVNTVLGFFKALLSKTATLPSDVGGTFDPATDSTEAIRDRGDAAWLTASGFSTLDAAGVRAAIDMASANLDTQLAALPASTRDAILNLNLGASYNNRTVLEAIKVALAVGAGVSAGSGTSSVAVKTPNGATTMFTATIDVDGNITAITWGTIP